ncbi:DNA repair protein RecO [candidate division GN15 bacterium]|nr:DNA repair protein RecO [candidate division GN15 bacterium]
MALEKTQAVVLKAFNWSESSRTVLFFSERFGKLPLVDKGGRSFKSRRGRLQPFAQLEITFYSSQKESSGYLSDIDTQRVYSLDSEGSLGRLAYASAACELLYLLLPEEEAQPELYRYFLTYLEKVEIADRRALPALFLSFFLRSMSLLGFHPSVSYCVVSGAEAAEIPLENGKLLFSPKRGGLIAPACQKPGEYYIGLSADQVKALSVLQRASLDEAAGVPLGFEDATFLVETLGKFLRYHSGLVSDLKSLEFLQKLKNSLLS